MSHGPFWGSQIPAIKYPLPLFSLSSSFFPQHHPPHLFHLGQALQTPSSLSKHIILYYLIQTHAPIVSSKHSHQLDSSICFLPQVPTQTVYLRPVSLSLRLSRHRHRFSAGYKYPLFLLLQKSFFTHFHHISTAHRTHSSTFSNLIWNPFRIQSLTL